MFLQLFAPLVFVILYNFSIRKLVFHRSRGINFNTFCGCFFDFISSVVFDNVFLTFRRNLGLHLASIFKKKRFRKWLRKKGPHTSKQHPMNMSGGSQGGRLACALFQKETIVSTRNNSLSTNCWICCSNLVFCQKMRFQIDSFLMLF